MVHQNWHGMNLTFDTQYSVIGVQVSSEIWCCDSFLYTPTPFFFIINIQRLHLRNTLYPVFFACHKFCEKKGKLVHFLFAEVIFCDLKRYIKNNMAHNNEYNFCVFYFSRIKNGREKCENQITAKKPGYTVYAVDNYGL